MSPSHATHRKKSEISPTSETHLPSVVLFSDANYQTTKLSKISASDLRHRLGVGGTLPSEQPRDSQRLRTQAVARISEGRKITGVAINLSSTEPEPTFSARPDVSSKPAAFTGSASEVLFFGAFRVFDARGPTTNPCQFQGHF